MTAPTVYKLKSPVSTEIYSLCEVPLRRIVPADRPAIAAAIRAERRRAGRPLSAKRSGAVIVSTVCGVPIEAAKRIGADDIRAICRMIGDALVRWAK